MSSYHENKEKLKDKYHNQGDKEKARKYYQNNKEIIRKKARVRYQIYLRNKKN